VDAVEGFEDLFDDGALVEGEEVVAAGLDDEGADGGVLDPVGDGLGRGGDEEALDLGEEVLEGGAGAHEGEVLDEVGVGVDEDGGDAALVLGLDLVVGPDLDLLGLGGVVGVGEDELLLAHALVEHGLVCVGPDDCSRGEEAAQVLEARARTRARGSKAPAAAASACAAASAPSASARSSSGPWAAKAARSRSSAPCPRTSSPFASAPPPAPSPSAPSRCTPSKGTTRSSPPAPAAPSAGCSPAFRAPAPPPQLHLLERLALLQVPLHHLLHLLLPSFLSRFFCLSGCSFTA